MQRNSKNPTPSAAEFGARAAVDVAIVSVAVLVIAVISAMIGCSGPAADNATTSGGVTDLAGSVTPHEPTPASPVSVGMDPQRGVAALGDSLPPDVMASVEDTLASPGDVIEITARGSDDVSQVGLSDGMGRLQLFTRDGDSRDWHVLYRVPLKTRGDRLALSVTAFNDLNRWRRVWVFVDVRQDGVGEREAAPAPTPVTGS